jgi:hypothetical protein
MLSSEYVASYIDSILYFFRAPFEMIAVQTSQDCHCGASQQGLSHCSASEPGFSGARALSGSLCTHRLTGCTPTNGPRALSGSLCTHRLTGCTPPNGPRALSGSLCTHRLTGCTPTNGPHAHTQRRTHKRGPGNHRLGYAFTDCPHTQGIHRLVMCGSLTGAHSQTRSAPPDP